MLGSKFACSASIGAVLVACADFSEPQSEPTARVEREIVGGTFIYNTDTGDDIIDAPVRLGSRLYQPNLDDRGNIFCSAVKIGPRRFVTAAHCHEGIYAAPGQGARVLITNRGCHPPQFAGDGCSVATGLPETGVDRFYIHSSYLGVGTSSSDVAVLDVLSDTPAIPTAPLDDTFLPDGFEGTLYGYGCTNPDTFASLGRRQVGVFQAQSLAETTADYPLVGVTTSPSELYSRHIVADGRFASPSVVQGCYGDSGGPLIAFRAAGPRVAGIASLALKGKDNAPITTFARVAQVASWLRAPTIKGRPGSITHALTGRCLSAFGSTTPRSTVNLQFCDGRAGTADTQYWRITTSATGFSTIRNGRSGLCLASTGSGDASVVQDTCRVGAAQEWMIAPGVGTTIRAQLTNRLAAGRLGYRSNGSRLDQRVEEQTNRQRWLIAPPS